MTVRADQRVFTVIAVDVEGEVVPDAVLSRLEQTAASDSE